MRDFLFKYYLLLCLCFVIQVAHAYDFETNGLSYTFINSNQVEVSGCDKNKTGSLVIPETVAYNGGTYQVISIGHEAFYRCRGLTSVTIPNSVTSIGDWAFAGCNGLVSVTFPNSVTSIGDYAFNGCSGLTSITIPNSVTSIGNWTFYGCSGLTSVTIGNSVVYIEDNAFQGCSGLTAVTIPNSVTSIGEAAFYGCSGLTSVTIGNSVTSIGESAFSRCSGLTSIIVESGNTHYDSRNNCNAIIETASNTLLFGCINTIIPNSVKSIGDRAFSSCSELTSVTIPNSVTSIGYGAFGGCSGLTSITIGNSVTSIGEKAFMDCRGLTAVTFPNSVTSIGDASFYNCSGLTSVTIPNSVTSIGQNAFYECSGLTSVNIGNSVTSIGYRAFCYCRGMTSINIGNSVTYIGDNAFLGCYGLTSIVVESGNSHYDSRNDCNAIIETASNTLLLGCNNTIIPNSVTSIGEKAFAWCRSLTAVTIPNSVTTIGEEAFYECSGLTSITIPNSVTYIRNYAFYGCGLKTVCTKITNPFPVNCFSSASIATLIVPRGTKSKYENLSGWSDFKEIKEEDANYYSLSITVDGFGSASYNNTTIRGGTRSFTIEEGSSATISFAPDDGYRIKSVKVNNTTVTISNNQYTINNISDNTTVNVEFEAIPPTTYTLSITSSVNGSATYNNTAIRNGTRSFTITEGASAIILFAPDEGYRIKSVKVNNGAVTVSNDQYTINNISANTTVNVEFEAIPPTTYTLNITSSGNGSITYDNITIRNGIRSFSITEGVSANILFAPDNGYRIKSVKINNVVVTVNSNQYTIYNISNNTTVSVEFEAIPPTTYTLSITTSGNGNVTYNNTAVRNNSQSFTITEGASAKILFSPDEGYRIKSVKANNAAVTVTNNQYTINNISANTTVNVEFEAIPPTTYTLNITSSGNGSVTYDNTAVRNNSQSFTITEGASAKILFTPDNGYRIKRVKANNAAVTVTNNQYTINNISANTTVNVEFEAIPATTYTLNITSSGNGSVTYDNTDVRSGSRSFTIIEGTSAAVSFTPDNGYRIASVKLNDKDVTTDVANNQYTISNITANAKLNVTFEAIPPTTYTLSIMSSGNGSVTYDNTDIRSESRSFTIIEGTSAAVSITPDNDYRIASVKLNDKDVTTDVSKNQYTISNITANTKLNVTFEAIPPTTYTLSIMSSGNGSVTYDNTAVRSGSRSFTINEGTSAAVSISPDDGYRIATVKLNDKDVTTDVANNQYTISSITANTKLNVTFEAIPPTTYTLSITSSGNGSITYDNIAVRNGSRSFTLNAGTSATVSFTPDDGYRIASVKLNDKDVTADVANNQYTVSNMTANAKFDVTFEAIPTTTYTLSITSSGNGSVTYDNTAVKNGSQSFTITEGTSAKILFAPDEGYRIKSVKVNNAAVTVNNNQYTINKISANTTVNVEFEAIPITTYTLSVSATGNGAVVYNSNSVRSKTASFTLNEGSSATISFTPDNGYRIASVKLNDKDVTTDVTNYQYTISSITANAKFDVTFEAIPPTTYTLSITSSGNGSVTYDKTTVRNNTRSFTINEGTSAAVSISPDNGYRIASVKLNGKDVTANVANSQYNIGDITDDTNLSVTFEAIPIVTYTLSVKSTGNGSASYDGTTIQGTASSFTVNEGTDATIVFTPNEGYQIKNVKVDNAVVVIVNNQYTIRNITKDTAVEVVFEEIPQIKPEPATYTLTIKATGNGAAKYHDAEIRGKTTPFSIEEGTNATITFTADEGYRIKEVKVNGEDVTSSISDNTCAINNIGKDTSVEVVFEEIPQIEPEPATYTLTIKATGNGSAYYGQETVKDGTGSFTVAEGASATIAFSPEHGHRIKSVMVNGSAVSIDNNQYTIDDIKKDMYVEVEFEAIPVTTYTLSVKASGNGSASFDGTTVKAETVTFTVNEGSTAILSFSPDNGNSVSVVMLNGKDITDKAMNNRVVIDEITQDITFEVVFKEDINALTVDGINYKVVSQSEKTVKVVGGDYGQVLTIPATVSQDGTTWKVTGIEKDALKDIAALCAVIWEPEALFTADVSNPNLLLYVKDSQYAPADIKNVVVNGSAASITLVDANSGNGFFCPQAFTAQKISYTHHYGMITGIGESRGWETIALPFDVQTVTHAVKGACRPFANWKSGDDARPFWLYELTGSGFAEAAGIEAYTPYVISMPNHEKYKDEFILSGNITFAATNTVIKKTEDVKIVTYGDRTFVPCYTDKTADLGLYALNVNNDWAKNNSGMTDGSRFVLNMRKIHPFEAYMVSTSNASRWYFDIFERATTAIKEIEKDLFKDEQVYDLQGRKTQTPHKKGIYVTNGKKLIVR